ncbi:MAG: hypothetical protein AAFV19_23425 [Pseudomonadota bacterium]
MERAANGSNLKVAAHVSVLRTGSGDGFVLSNDVSGTSFLTDKRTVSFLDLLREQMLAGPAAKAAGFTEAQANETIQQLVAHGFLVADGHTQPAQTARKPIESQLIFFRIGLLDAGPVTRLLRPILGPLFTAPLVLLWCVLVTAAIINVLGEPDAFRLALLDLANLTWMNGLQLAVIFVGLKLFHELGHATALVVCAEREGIPLGGIPAGISFFAFFPFPYTDATAAWKIRSRWRRAIVGLGGIYFEVWIAACVALVWANIAPGELQRVLFQVLLISGASTLLFNLNPLVRLDGYFIYSDLADRPNLGTRASAAARGVGLWLLGVKVERIGRYHLSYWALSYLYRWVIFAGIFWAAYVIDPRLSWIVAAISLMTLIVRPLINLFGAARGKRLSWIRPALTSTGLAALAAILFVPVAYTEYLPARLVTYESEPVRVRENVLVVSASRAQAVPSGTAVLLLSSPELTLQHALLTSERELAEGTLRREGGRDAAAAQVLTAELTRIDKTLEQIAERQAALDLTLRDQGVWEPREAQRVTGSWLSAVHNRDLGQISYPVARVIRADIDQSLSELGEHLAPDTDLQFRPMADPACTGTARFQRFTPSNDLGAPGFVLIASVPVDASCLLGAPSGAGVVLRVARADASLARQFYLKLSQLALNRLPRDLVYQQDP